MAHRKLLLQKALSDEACLFLQGGDYATSEDSDHDDRYEPRPILNNNNHSEGQEEFCSGSSTSSSPPPLTPLKALAKKTTAGDPLLHCGICNKEEKVLLVNYGANSCFSCRAFFRRAQNSLYRGGNLKCAHGGGCDVDVTKRSTLCRKCRFEKCIGLGMNPALVLDSEGKKNRFKKGSYRYKTREEHKTDQIRRKRSIHSDEEEPQPSEPEAAPCSDVKRIKVELSDSRGSDVTLSELFSSSMSSTPLCTHFLNKVQQCGRDGRFLMGALAPEDLAVLVDGLGQQFHRFAMGQADFRALPEADQAALLHANTPAFVHFLLARAFTAGTGFEQLNSLVGGGLERTRPMLQDVVSRLEFRDFVAMTDMFQGDQTRETYYYAYVCKLRALASFGSVEMGEFAATVLFRAGGLRLEGYAVAEGVYRERLGQLCRDQGWNYQDFVDALQHIEFLGSFAERV